MTRKSSVERISTIALLVGVVLVVLFLAWQQTGAEEGAVAESSATPVAAAADTQGGDAADARAAGNTTDSAETSLDLAAVPVRQDQGLVPALNPNTYQGKLPEHTFEQYVVERGDTPGGIAETFNISPETLLGGNEFLSNESSLLQVGTTLTILPINGVLHDVRPGDTLEGIANKYGVPIEDIIAYEPNNLEFPYRVYPDTQILVPGAVRELFVWTPPQLPPRNSAWWGSQSQPYIVGTGSFIFPVNSRNYTQYYWYGHPGLDIGLPVGSPVYATDDGTVVYAGWNVYGYGNLIVVNHGNGFETFYAHLNGFNVVAGQIVYKGNLIGYSGDTGNSSGPHIHYEIRLNGNRDDPCWYIGC